MSRFHLIYRGKHFAIPKAGYDSIAKDLLVDPSEVVKKAIDRFIDAGMEFSDIHVYVSYSQDNKFYINFIAMDKGYE